MIRKMPEKSEGKDLDRTVVDFEEAEVGKKYRMNRRNPETGEMEEVEVRITSKERNETTDGSPGVEILSYQHET